MIARTHVTSDHLLLLSNEKNGKFQHVVEIMRMRMRVFCRVKMADCLYAYYAGNAQISAMEHIQKKRLD